MKAPFIRSLLPMPYLSKTLPNGKEVGISNCELILPANSLKGLSDAEIVDLVHELTGDLEYLKDYLGNPKFEVSTIQEARQEAKLEKMAQRDRAVKRQLTH